MSAPFRRAAIVLSKAATKVAPLSSEPLTTSGSTVAAAAAALNAAKAITVEEAKTAVPHVTSTTESMMPWEGWFSSFLKSKMGDKYYQPFRDFWTFRPDDQHRMEQQIYPNTKVVVGKNGETAMFRHPSPGSQDPVRLPDADVGHYREDPYNVTYYPTDTRRRHVDPAYPDKDMEQLKIDMMSDSDDPRVDAARKKFEEGPGSSPGNRGTFATGKSDYDPTGLRATMSANHDSMNAELDKVSPNHLPTYSWVKDEDKIIAWHEERDLPMPPGGTGHTFIPVEGRIARW